MNTVRSTAIICLVTAFWGSVCLGEQWISPDGVITVEAPNSSDFERVDEPPTPFIALWISRDETLRFGVIKVDLPQSGKLIRSSVEEGMMEEVGGSITASSSTVKNGHEIWLMSAKGSIQGTRIRITQAVAPHNTHCYKVMAASVGDQPVDTAQIDSFVNSINITTQNQTTESTSIAGGNPVLNPGIDLHELSKRIGGVSALLLIGFLVWLVARRTRSQAVK